MANALGARLLYRYSIGEATVDQLAVALSRGWITQDEHDAAVEPAP